MSTMIGKIKSLVPDQAMGVAASATQLGTAANKGTATDLQLILSNTGASGTVTPSVQGANATGGAWTTVTPDKGTLVNLAAGASVQVVHLGQLFYQFYRVVYTSAAASGTTATDVFNFMPTIDSFDTSVA